MRRFHYIAILALLFSALAMPAPLFAASGGDQGKLNSSALFKKTSPAVVLLIGKDSIGSGSILNGTDILTNWHVVEANSRILVAFKPEQEGGKLDPDKFVVGDVIKKNVGKDLALVRVKRIPSYVTPIPLGSEDELEIGADVHAIGHPQGEIWTYTKGVISQLRKNFTYQQRGGTKFQADVIQTQTPINPGNSGGPLISDQGRLVGVNSFKASGSEGLNFAVALGEVVAFVGSQPTPKQPKGASPDDTPKKGGKNAGAGDSASKDDQDKPGPTYQGRDADNTGYMRQFGDADDGVTLTYFYPDDKSKPIFAFRTDGDDITDVIILDTNRDGKWDYSVHDKDKNGKFDSIGLHPNGKMKPTSYVPFSDPKVGPTVKAALPRSLPETGPKSATAPSFDCATAETLVQRTVCSSETLADLDVAVAALFSRVMEKRESMRDQLKNGQQEWVRGTENQCREGDVAACVEGRYKQRVIYLNVLMLQ